MKWLNYFSCKHEYLIHMINSLWGLVCMFAICAMAGIIGYWIGQPQFFFAISQSSSIILDVSSEGDSYQPNIVISGSGKATYSQWIEDISGHIVFRYKTFVLESNGAIVQHEQVSIPPLPVGRYYIKAEMVNQPNPIKSTKVDLILGMINVVSPEYIESKN